jgi:type II secretory pathway pseudopilin PulG
MPRLRRKRDVTLPWEQRGAWLRDLLSGHRWKMLLFVALGLALLALTWHEAGRRARVRETRVAISEVKRAIASFRSDVGRCPRSTSELLHPPDPADRYLRRIPKDGWGRRLWIECPAPHDPRGAEVVSAGPSGSFFTDDNVQ